MSCILELLPFIFAGSIVTTTFLLLFTFGLLFSIMGVFRK